MFPAEHLCLGTFVFFIVRDDDVTIFRCLFVHIGEGLVRILITGEVGTEIRLVEVFIIMAFLPVQLVLQLVRQHGKVITQVNHFDPPPL